MTNEELLARTAIELETLRSNFKSNITQIAHLAILRRVLMNDLKGRSSIIWEALMQTTIDMTQTAIQNKDLVRALFYVEVTNYLLGMEK